MIKKSSEIKAIPELIKILDVAGCIVTIDAMGCQKEIGKLAWRKRRYEAAFIAKLNDCEAEAAETQTWVDFAVECGYIDVSTGRELYARYNQVLSGLVSMINNPSPWLLNR